MCYKRHEKMEYIHTKVPVVLRLGYIPWVSFSNLSGKTFNRYETIYWLYIKFKHNQTPSKFPDVKEGAGGGEGGWKEPISKTTTLEVQVANPFYLIE